MTDKEIINSLAICGDYTVECEGCSYNEVKFCHCSLKSDALELIKRQQAEIERLKKYNTDVAHKHYDDGIKEFAERLKRELDMISYETAFEYQDTIETIDDLVKEMGADNG